MTITASGRFNASPFTGLTFSTNTTVEELIFHIGIDSPSSQSATTINHGPDGRRVVTDALSIDTTVDNVFYITFQSDDPYEDIVFLEGTYCVLKSVTMEMIIP